VVPKRLRRTKDRITAKIQIVKHLRDASRFIAVFVTAATGALMLLKDDRYPEQPLKTQIQVR
jgi:hypothetical protein